MKPGITGLAQAKGFRGETAEFSDMSGRVRLRSLLCQKLVAFAGLQNHRSYRCFDPQG